MKNYLFLFLSVLSLVSISAAEAAEKIEPKISTAEKIECHGTLHGKEFWLRLLPADKRYQNLRILELTYTPPAKEQIDGCHLVDHPQILLNADLEVIAWKEGRGVHQSGLSAVIYQPAQKGYDVARELDIDGEVAQQGKKIAATDAGWDVHLLPLLMTLVDVKADFKQEAYDLFGSSTEQTAIAKTGTSLQVGKDRWQLVYDDAGKLKQILAPKDKLVLRIDGWR